MRVHAVQTGRVQIKTAQVKGRGAGAMRQLNLFLDRQWTDWLPTYAWVIEHEEGPIVVDTGEATQLLHLQSLHPYLRWEVRFDIQPEQEIGPQLKALGIGSNDVKTVVMTHLHSDHEAGLAHFPHSRILVMPGEYRRATGIRGQIRGYLPQHWPSWFAPKELTLADGAFGPFPASQRLTRGGDVIVVPTPGHTPDHVSVIAQGEGIDYFLAGDTSYTEALMLNDDVDGVAPNVDIARQTLARIRQFTQANPTVYLPTHDPDAADRLARGQTVPALTPGAVSE